MSMLAAIEKFIYDHLHPRVIALEARVAELEERVKELLGKKPESKPEPEPEPETPANDTHSEDKA
jgi:hypothetical protein